MTEMATRGRKALTLGEKINKCKTGELSPAAQAYFDWLSDQAGVELDSVTFSLTNTLYTEYTSTKEFQAAKAERDAAKEKAAKEKAAKEFAKFQELAAKFGKKIVDVEDDEDSEDEDSED